MVIKGKHMDRECISGAIVLICIFTIIISALGIRLLDVKVNNIELVDRGLYTVITSNGPINVSQDDVLRIERTYPQVALTGKIVGQDKIYTTKGFLSVSEADPFYHQALLLVNSVNFEGKDVWIKTDTDGATESAQNWNQLMQSNLKTIQPLSYVIGTPSNHVSLVSFVLFLQYLAIAVCGIALIIFIFPLRFDPSVPAQTLIQEDQEHSPSEEAAKAAVK